MPSTADRYVPASGFAWLTGTYDVSVALSMRERAWRPALVRAAARGDEAKAAALEHLAGVLTSRGVLHVADWGPPRGPAAALGARALQLFDGREGPQSLLDGLLPATLAAAGFTASRRQAALRTVWGTLEVWRAQR